MSTSGPVVLVGPPGSGKSTVGPLLAELLGVDYADADADLEQRTGKLISDIFAADGEPAFRAIEQDVVADGLARHAGVFALGGGAPLAEVTRARLSEHTVVFLFVGMAEGVQRTGLSTARPLLAGVNPRATFKELLDKRLPVYREVATIEVDTTGRKPREIAAEIAGRLGREPVGQAGHGAADESFVE
ncbi:shikimate kinase [Prauserella cavernicola]|uniref:Shikimate kinase n=1 Tax=Prauserella cavernicola TaxID=2800127 RepID=A0A934QTU7_9PSEU|nr:shikimate kinase [Prauserella cavernicola]MBK1788137.1 shikimate kinase [Prauserella cavernicola]